MGAIGESGAGVVIKQPFLYFRCNFISLGEKVGFVGQRGLLSNIATAWSKRFRGIFGTSTFTWLWVWPRPW